MAHQTRRVLDHLRDSFRKTQSGSVPDAHLLRRWAAERDEVAFELLVRRHGPMVLGVCRRMLRHPQDAEDAFQATFLALVRRAGSISRHGAVGGWLYRVAYRVALRARMRTNGRTRHTADLNELEAPAADELIWRDLRPILDEEVGRLPRRYREAFILCYFQEKTNEEAARELGCPVGTVVSRLSRAREHLRARLARRGVTLSAAVFAAAGLQGVATAAVRPALIAATVRMGAPSASAIPASVSTLANGVLQTMLLTKLKIAAAVLMAIGLMGFGSHALMFRSQAAQQGDDPTTAAQSGGPVAGDSSLQKVTVYEGGTAPVQSLAFSPDGRTLALGDGKGAVVLWDVTGRAATDLLAQRTQGGTQVAFSPDGRLLVVTGKDGLIHVRDVATRQHLWQNRVKDTLSGAAFTPDGKTLAVAGDGRVRLFDARTGKEVRQIGKADDLVRIFHSRDGSWLFLGTSGRTVRIWDVETGKAARELRTSSDVAAVAVSPDGKIIVTAGADGNIYMFDLATGRELRHIAGHKGAVATVAFSPDGKLIASGGKDGTVRLWDAATGKELKSGRHQGSVIIIIFSPDGRLLASGGADQKAVIWDWVRKRPLPAAKIQRAAPDRLGRLVQELVSSQKGDAECIDALYLAALARYPAEAERNFAIKHLSRQKDRQQGLDDLLWSLINTREFETHVGELNRRDPRKALRDGRQPGR